MFVEKCIGLKEEGIRVYRWKLGYHVHVRVCGTSRKIMIHEEPELAQHSLYVWPAARAAACFFLPSKCRPTVGKTLSATTSPTTIPVVFLIPTVVNMGGNLVAC